MGNSEVGHLNIGAGRVVHMDVTRIDLMIATGEFYQNPLLLDLMQYARAGRRLHIMGLCSDGGVHSLLEHLYAVVRMAKKEKVESVFIHCFMDGRDTPPESGIGFIRAIQKNLRETGVGQIATVSGRYYAMDRDKRWERIEKAFDAMVLGKGEKWLDPFAAMQRSYEKGVTDEFVEPVTIVDGKNVPVGLIREGDACFFFNYRADRGREMTEALTSITLERPARALVPQNLKFATMTQYDKSLNVPMVLAREPLNNILGYVCQELNWKNLRIAETEKYAHVTYFFNGGIEKPFTGEEREMVASPKVATYDLKPEMSADGVTEIVLDAMGRKDFDVIVMNFANADMVGHSGKLEPTIRAVEKVDECLGPHLAAVEREERTLDHHRRSWQCGNHDRPGYEGSAHLSHDEPGTADSGGRFGRSSATGRGAAGCRADHPWRVGRETAKRHDGPRPSHELRTNLNQ